MWIHIDYTMDDLCAFISQIIGWKQNFFIKYQFESKNGNEIFFKLNELKKVQIIKCGRNFLSYEQIRY